MPRWVRIVLVMVGVLGVIGGGAYYWLIAESGSPSSPPPFDLDIARVRALAAELPGDKVTQIHVANVATLNFPRTAVVAGDGWAGLPMGVFSYQLVFPDQSIVIDTAFDEAGGRQMNAAFDPSAYSAMDRAMAQASQIVVTHEHPDHLGGILAYPDPEDLAPKLTLTREQIATAGRYGGFSVPTPVLVAASPLHYDDYLAIAPGVVLIKAPGHSPGSQMVFVSLADGREFLFVGDIGWTMENIVSVRGRARLVSQFLLGEDRDVVFGQLQALHDLGVSEPKLNIVPGHDLAFVSALIASGAMTEGFALAPI